MSTIALVVADSAHAATANTKSLLVALGHTVNTYLEDALATPANLVGDLVVTCRLDSSKGATTGPRIAAMLLLDRPLLLGTVHAGTSPSPITAAGLLGDVEIVGSVASKIQISNITHPVTKGYGMLETVMVTSAETFGAGLTAAAVGQFTGTQLAVNLQTGRGSMWAVNRGDVARSGTAVVPRIVIGDWIYGTTAYENTVAGKMFYAAISWLLSTTDAATYPNANPGLGVLWPRPTPPVGTGIIPAIRQTAKLTAVSGMGVLAFQSMFQLIWAQSSGPGRLRLYRTSADRLADENRAHTEAPAVQSIVLAEYRWTAAGKFWATGYSVQLEDSQRSVYYNFTEGTADVEIRWIGEY
jgi:hypothetical protein